MINDKCNEKGAEHQARSRGKNEREQEADFQKLSSEDKERDLKRVKDDAAAKKYLFPLC
jgi:hypothetical protein